jgi:hypothetical protein
MYGRSKAMTRMLGGHIFPDIYSHILIGQRNSKECAIKARGAADDISPSSIALLLIYYGR